MSNVYTYDELDTLSRRQLQDLAKSYKIKANQKTSSLVEKLKEYYKNQEREKDKENEIPNKNTKNIKKKRIEMEERGEDDEEVTIKPPPEKKIKKNKEEGPLKPHVMENEKIGKEGKEKKIKNKEKKNEIQPPTTPIQIMDEEEENEKSSPPPHVDNKLNEKPKKSTNTEKTKNSLFPELSKISALPWVNSCVNHVRVLTSLDKSLGVSSSSLMFSNNLLVKCLLEIFLVGLKLSEKKTLTLSILEQGMKEIIPGDLFKHGRSEVRKATTRFNSTSNPERPISYRSGLMFDVDEVAQFLKTIGIVTDTFECTVGVTALTEYLCAEIYDQAFQKIKEKKSILVTVKYIIEGIKADSELWGLFKRFLEEPSMTKTDQIKHIFGTLPKSEEISGASPKAIQRLTSRLQFELPESLSQFFHLSNGHPSLGVDSSTEIAEIFSKYELLEEVYQLIGWIPIHHVLDEVYNCLDVDTDRVIQIDAIALKNIEKFPVLANSLCEYITKFVSSDDMKGRVEQDYPSLQEVDPLVGKLVNLLL